MRTVFSLLLLSLASSAVVYSCDDKTQYDKDGQCCKMCGPGKRMKQNTDCNDPTCQDCEDGEYQDGFTKETKCKRQPYCNKNLNFEVDYYPSKTQLQKCKCIPDHHCSSSECISCVSNTVCQPGERVSKIATSTSDTKCEPCPNGTFSSESSRLDCLPWTECSFGHVEKVLGSSTSDRICAANAGLYIGIFVIVLVIIAIAAGLWYLYKKGKAGSACLEEKFQKLVLCNAMPDTNQPAEDKVTVENEEPLIEPENEQPKNEPQENIDETRLDDHFKLGLSANGMPVDQDHSKLSILSQPESDPSSDTFLGHF